MDVGAKRTGVARASSVARIAEPLKSVLTEDAVNTLQKYAREHKVEAIAIGLPRNLSGEDSRQTAWVREWVDKAKKQIEMALYWQDEALTSREAAKHQTSNIKHQNTDEHALAAAIILQDFLDAAEADRTPV